MEVIFWSSAQNLIIAGIGAITALSWKTLRDKYKSRAERKFWRPLMKQGNLQVYLTTRKGPLVRNAPRVDLAEVQVLTGLAPILSATGIDWNIHDLGLADTNPLLERDLKALSEHNLLILGGPSVNRVTKEVMQLLRDRLPVALKLDPPHPPYIVSGDCEFSPIYAQDGSILKDYGLIIRAHNPFDVSNKTWCVIIMGCHGYGTKGAAEALQDRISMKDLMRQIQNKPSVVIFEVDRKNSPSKIRKVQVAVTPEI